MSGLGAGTAARAPDFLLATRGISQALGDYVAGVAFVGNHVGFALGDGTLRLVTPADPGDWRDIAVHDGAILSLAASGEGFVTGGDDGKFRLVTPDGTVSDLGSFGGKWVDHVAAWPGGKGKALYACAVGKSVHVYDADGKWLKTLDHPSSVGGLAFDARGKRIAVAHYGGVSLWYVAAKTDTRRLLEWKGSHIGVTFSPDGETVVTAMQENALHGWRLADGQHMKMSGYPSKTRALSFTRNGKWLATSGADAIVLWPFVGNGPTGKQPTELAAGDKVICTVVATHPQQDSVAGGYADGLVVLTDIASARILPVAMEGRGGVSAMAWNPTGTHLAFGTEDGFAAVIDFSRRG